MYQLQNENIVLSVLLTSCHFRRLNPIIAWLDTNLKDYECIDIRIIEGSTSITLTVRDLRNRGVPVHPEDLRLSLAWDLRLDEPEIYRGKDVWLNRNWVRGKRWKRLVDQCTLSDVSLYRTYMLVLKDYLHQMIRTNIKERV